MSEENPHGTAEGSSVEQTPLEAQSLEQHEGDVPATETAQPPADGRDLETEPNREPEIAEQVDDDPVSAPPTDKPEEDQVQPEEADVQPAEKDDRTEPEPLPVGRESETEPNREPEIAEQVDDNPVSAPPTEADASAGEAPSTSPDESGSEAAQNRDREGADYGDEQPAGAAEYTLIADELFDAPESRATVEESDAATLKALVEAVVYVLPEPLPAAQIAAALNQPFERVDEALKQLMEETAREDRGVFLREVAGGYQIATKPEHHEAIRAFVKNLKQPLKLSNAALETLAVIAYKQPVTAPEIMEIRGVQGVGVLKTLLDRKLVTAAGRKAVLGKPILYKTTKEFLTQFGLKDLAELPTLKEFEEIRRQSFSDDDEIQQREAQPVDAAPPSAADLVAEEVAAGRDEEPSVQPEAAPELQPEPQEPSPKENDG
jgi:segregation and condensation protein B